MVGIQKRKHTRNKTRDTLLLGGSRKTWASGGPPKTHRIISSRTESRNNGKAVTKTYHAKSHGNWMWERGRQTWVSGGPPKTRQTNRSRTECRIKTTENITSSQMRLGGGHETWVCGGPPKKHWTNHSRTEC
jgi:hypothetical protein